MAGLPVNKGEIDQSVGNTARLVFNALDMVDKLKDWLDTVSASDLENIYGYTTTEAAQIKSAYGDLKKIADTFRGDDTVSVAYDHRTFAKLLIGTGLY